MATDLKTSFWRDFIKAWECLDDIEITDVIVSPQTADILPSKNTSRCFSKHAVHDKALGYLSMFKRTFKERPIFKPHNELKAYKREYFNYNRCFVESRNINCMGLLIESDYELPDNAPTEIKAVIRSEGIERIEFNDIATKPNHYKDNKSVLYFPLKMLDVNRTEYIPQVGGWTECDVWGGVQLADIEKGEHHGKIYFYDNEYPFLPYVIGKAYYCSYLFNHINELERNGRDTRNNDTDNGKQKPTPKTFADIFVNDEWSKYINVLCEVEPVLLKKDNNGKYVFVGNPKKHKGVICSWIKNLQDKNIIHFESRQNLSLVLNAEIKEFNLGKDGKTFDNISSDYRKNYQNILLKKVGLLP